jgi:hypothetical protein
MLKLFLSKNKAEEEVARKKKFRGNKDMGKINFTRSKIVF